VAASDPPRAAGTATSFWYVAAAAVLSQADASVNVGMHISSAKHFGFQQSYTQARKMSPEAVFS
jgi:hypothetical protein